MSGNNQAQTEAMAQAIGRRLCSQCQRHLPLEGGGWRITANRARRWMCVTCRQRQRDYGKKS